MKVQPEFAQRLRESGLSAQEIADHCGVTRQNAGLWLAGRIRKPHPGNRQRIDGLLAALGDNARTNGGTP